MDEQKGWLEMFSVAEKICSTSEDVEFYFYGGVGVSTPIKIIEEKFKASQFSDRIKWLGAVYEEDKNMAYKSMDLFCMPSHTEAFPLSILEAMMHSLPIVATDVGAVSDAVENGKGGWLCSPRDEESLLRTVQLALESQDNWAAMGALNRLKFSECFSLDAFKESWQKVIHDLMK
ncbi:glycosyltransferase [Persicirhabdus sediminis]|uniref:Glycosyltransferase n=2 Tax=Persicirhabdus sediminis TaxID=454144 RepID=A0A8J7MIS6_9BACT|nr:glycosyltransferase [Persicirhabdus sediminis]